MKSLRRLVLAILLTVSMAPLAMAKDVSVQGYFRHNGTYVQPHHRSAPNGNVFDNWSTYPNVNPYTGRQGTYRPYGSMESWDASKYGLEIR